MGTPAEYLPGALHHDSINALFKSLGMPQPQAIISPKVAAQFHSIYMITLPADGTSTCKELVLRVSGRHLPKIKTENEVAIMSWVSKNTNIPIPTVVASDSTDQNPIGYEYTLLSRVSGETISDIYRQLTESELVNIIDQLIDILIQLHATDWSAISGLTFDQDGTIIPGPILDENHWQVPDIEKFWPTTESTTTLNPQGPYPTYAAYISAHITHYIHAIQIHPSLSSMRDTIPRLQAFVHALESNDPTTLNTTSLKLAHKDLHFGNIIYSRSTHLITAILDWEFASIVPFTLWNPSRSFLWNGHHTPDTKLEKERCMRIFVARCQERKVSLLDDAEFACERQRAMQKVMDYLRSIVEVCPRGQGGEVVVKWRAIVLHCIDVFGV